jgi:hypothetical protein
MQALYENEDKRMAQNVLAIVRGGLSLRTIG